MLGLYYATREKIGAAGEGMHFSDVAEVARAYESRQVELHAKITVRIKEAEKRNGERVEKITRYETTVGRALLSEILPVGLPFSFINKPLKKKEISRIINASFRRCSLRETVIFADKLMQAGYGLATRGGISFAADDMLVPPEKRTIIEKSEREVKEIEAQYTSGLVTQGERYNKVVDIWGRAGDEIAKAMMTQLGSMEVTDRDGKKVKQDSFNSIFMMADSGARGSAAQIRQLAGMRGLMAKPDGSIIETPITANFREGLNVLQYFISTHGARKGLADTALKTANSGYLTRRLVDVTQDLVVTEDDCSTRNGVAMKALVEGGEVVEPLRERILGRTVVADVVHPETQATLYDPGTLLGEDEVEQIELLGIDEVKVRTPLTCDTRYGLCASCYGRDLGRGHLVNVGEAVGVIAAQSIGEPGTQLTMRTFHIGGAASRTAAASQVESKSAGTVRFSALMRYVTNAKGELIAIGRSGEITIHDDNGRERERHKVPYGATLQVKDGDAIKAGKDARDLGRHRAPDHHRVRRHGEVRERRGRRDGREAGRRSHRPVHAGRHRSEAPCRHVGEGRAAAGEAARREGRRDQAGRFRPAGEHHVPARLDHHRQGRPAGGRRRSARADPAGDVARPATSPAVCRALRSCSKRARRRTRACSRKSRAPRRSARTRRASSGWSSPTSTASPTSS